MSAPPATAPAVAKASAPPFPRPSLPVDTGLLAGRHLRLMSKRPASLISALVLPIVFAVLFYVVFGGLMERRVGVDYAQYLLPALIIQAMLFTAMSAAMLAVEDVKGGTIRRLRTMAVSPASPVLGLVGAELCRALITMGVLIPTGLVLGFRFQGGPVAAVGFVLLSLLFGAAICTGFVSLGLAVGRIDLVQVLTNIIYYPLLLMSNAFVPASAFPSWLRPIAENQPLSAVAEALRALAGVADGDETRSVLVALLWLTGALVGCSLLAVRAYRRAR